MRSVTVQRLKHKHQFCSAKEEINVGSFSGRRDRSGENTCACARRETGRVYTYGDPPTLPVELSERAAPHGVRLSRQHPGVGVRFGSQLEVPTAVVRFNVSGCSCWGTTSISVLKDLCDT